MKLFFTLWFPAAAFVIGCGPGLDAPAVAAGQSSAGATSGGYDGVTTTAGAGGAPGKAASSGVGGARESATAASSGGDGGAPAVKSSATTVGSGGAAPLSTSASSASCGGVGGSTTRTSSAVGSGSSGASGAGGAIGRGPPAPICPLCSDALNNLASPDTLCIASQTKYLAIVQCACKDTCAAVCGVLGSTDCLASWKGNTPPDCAACLASASGCLTVRDACIGDDGVSTTVGTVDTPP
ncbi:MAG: hypothetical protein ABJE95_23385 [Byssovorax sp.]